jgi:nicotinamide-nucleotide amidase
MKAEIISIGDELLIGQTINTNAAWLGNELNSIGFEIYQITSVSDKREHIMKALEDATGRSEVVILTGGLGPTSDDITKPVLCEFFNTRLVANAEVFEMIRNLLSRRGFVMNDNNRRQAEIPEACRILPNSAGTAPGMWFEMGGSVFVSLPGVPHEMKQITSEYLIPELKKRFVSQVILHRNIMTFGTFEARLAEILTQFEADLPPSVKLAYLPSFGVIKLRLTSSGNDAGNVVKTLEEQGNKLYKLIPEFIFGENEITLEESVGRLLKNRKATLCTAESCTGGQIAAMITSIPGSSDYFLGSLIAYSNSVKTGILAIPDEMIRTHGAVSREVAESMAKGARQLFKADFAVSTSGIAGPEGGTDVKPVGTIWIAISSGNETISEKFTFGNDRNINIRRFSLTALNLLRNQIIKH